MITLFQGGGIQLLADFSTNLGEGEKPPRILFLQFDEMNPKAGLQRLTHFADGQFLEGHLLDLFEQATSLHPTDIPTLHGTRTFGIGAGQLRKLFSGQGPLADLPGLERDLLVPLGGSGLRQRKEDMAQPDPLLSGELF